MLFAERTVLILNRDKGSSFCALAYQFDETHFRSFVCLIKNVSFELRLRHDFVFCVVASFAQTVKSVRLLWNFRCLLKSIFFLIIIIGMKIAYSTTRNKCFFFLSSDVLLLLLLLTLISFGVRLDISELLFVCLMCTTLQRLSILTKALFFVYIYVSFYINYFGSAYDPFCAY